MEFIRDEELEVLGEQFTVLKQMTFLQFIEAVRSGRIKLNVPGLNANG